MDFNVIDYLAYHADVAVPAIILMVIVSTIYLIFYGIRPIKTRFFILFLLSIVSLIIFVMDNPLYYYSCFASDKYVYAVYRESKKDTDETNPLYLEQFDWDGNPVARYSLPKGRGLYTGCATEDNSIIYMVDYYEDNFLHKIVLSKD